MINNQQRSLLLLLSLTFLSTMVGCSSQNNNSVAQAATVFKCEQQGDKWVTIAQRDNAVSQTPLFNWNTTQFGDEWTPEKRCKHVADKLTTIVGANGGRLGNLDLTYGKIDNGYTVICVLNNEEKSCTKDNILFTLNAKNSQEPSLILLKISNFAEGKSAGVTIDENGQPQYVSLEMMVDRSLGQVW